MKMYGNRPPVPPSQGSQNFKCNIPEACDRIKQEYEYINSQMHQMKLEYEKVLQEKYDLQRNYVMYYEMSYGLNVEMHKQTEIVKRLTAILGQIIPFLSVEHQSQVAVAVERAKTVTQSELNSIIAEDTKYGKLSNGGSVNSFTAAAAAAAASAASGGGPSGTVAPPGFTAEQVEAFKAHITALAVQAGSSGAGPPGLPPNLLPPGSGPNSTVSVSGALSNSVNISSGPGSCAGGPPGYSQAGAGTGGANTSVASAAAALLGLANNPAMAMAFASQFGAGNPSGTTSASAALKQEAEKQQQHQHQYQQLQQHMQQMAAASASSVHLGGSVGNVNNSAIVTNSSFPNLSCGSGPMSNNLPLSGHGEHHDMKHRSRSRSPGHETKKIKLEMNRDDDNDELVVDDIDGKNTPPIDSVTSNNIDRSTPNTKAGFSNSTARSALGSAFPGLGSTVDGVHAGGGSTIGPSGSGGPVHPGSLIPPPFGPGGSTVSGAGGGSGVVPPPFNTLPGFNNPAQLSSLMAGRMPTGFDTSILMRMAAAGFTGGHLPGHLGHHSQAALLSAAAQAAASQQQLHQNVSGANNPLAAAVNAAAAASSANQPPKQYSYTVHVEAGENGAMVSRGEPQPTSFPSSTSNVTDLPKVLKPLTTFPHGEVVCAVTLSPNTERVHTGGRGVVKLWDFQQATTGAKMQAIMSLDCLSKDNYIRSVKLLSDSKTMIVGGEANRIAIWDLGQNEGACRSELISQAQACYALGISTDNRHCFSCGSDGQITIWDINNQSVVRSFVAHTDGASCIDVVPDGNRFWTGGLDNTAKCWDIRMLPTIGLNGPSASTARASASATPVNGGTANNNVITEASNSNPLPVGSPNSCSSYPSNPASHPGERAATPGGSSGTGISETPTIHTNPTSTPQPSGGSGTPGVASSTPNNNINNPASVGASGGNMANTGSGAGGLSSSGCSGNIIMEPPRVLHTHSFNAQVFSLGYCHANEWVAVGLENAAIEVFPTPYNTLIPNSSRNERFELRLHDSCVLSLKFAKSGKWFISTGKDNSLHGWKTPYGYHLFSTKEAASVLTCDISPDDKYVVTGSGDKKATLYEVLVPS